MAFVTRHDASVQAKENRGGRGATGPRMHRLYAALPAASLMMGFRSAGRFYDSCFRFAFISSRGQDDVIKSKDGLRAMPLKHDDSATVTRPQREIDSWIADDANERFRQADA